MPDNNPICLINDSYIDETFTLTRRLSASRAKNENNNQIQKHNTSIVFCEEKIIMLYICKIVTEEKNKVD